MIRSTLLLSSRVSETLEVKVLLKRGGHYLHKLHPESDLPSFTLQPEDVSAVKLRLDNSQALWSQEVLVTMESFKGGKLVKVRIIAGVLITMESFKGEKSVKVKIIRGSTCHHDWLLLLLAIIKTGSARETKSRLCASPFTQVKPPITARSGYGGI